MKVWDGKMFFFSNFSTGRRNYVFVVFKSGVEILSEFGEEQCKIQYRV